MNGISTQVAPGTYALSSILNTYNKSMSKSLERIASGLKINSPSDDISSFFRAKELNALAASSEKAASALEDHISRLKTAEDALTTISDLMDEMSSLAKEASTEADADKRASLGEQYDNIRDAINTVVNTTRYKGELIINGSFDSDATVSNTAGTLVDVQIGEDLNDKFSYAILDTRLGPDGANGTNSLNGLNLATTSAETSWADAVNGQSNALETYKDIEEEDSGQIRLRRNLSRISTNLSVINGAKTSLENKQNNYQAASSSLVGIDQAVETSRYASMQIQQQATASFLAQSNMSYGNVVGMLTGMARR